MISGRPDILPDTESGWIPDYSNSYFKPKLRPCIGGEAEEGEGGWERECLNTTVFMVNTQKTFGSVTSIYQSKYDTRYIRTI